jgi:hypothetical protein
VLNSLRHTAGLLLGIALAAPADALCYYHGVNHAPSTIRGEYGESRWVVRARVLSAFDGEVEPRSPDAGMMFTVYRLQVVRAHKGRPPQRLRFFTERNSGAFYMDLPWRPLAASHDVGGEYLLFLNPIAADRRRPAAARNAVFVNYSCGQSRRWSEVPASARRQLAALARRH